MAVICHVCLRAGFFGGGGGGGSRPKFTAEIFRYWLRRVIMTVQFFIDFFPAITMTAKYYNELHVTMTSQHLQLKSTVMSSSQQ